MTNATYQHLTDAYLLEELGTGATTLLGLDATGGGHELVDDWAGPSDATPAAASIIHFDGPTSPAMYAAGERAAHERIQPALAQVPGVIRMLVLWQPVDRSLIVTILADSVDTLEAAGKAVNATELLPGEDPALLRGPDRAGFHRIVAHFPKDAS